MGKEGRKREDKQKSHNVILGFILLFFVLLLIFMFSFQKSKVIRELPTRGLAGNISYTVGGVDKNKCQENKDYLISGHNVTIYMSYGLRDCYDLSCNITTNESGIYLTPIISQQKEICIMAAVMNPLKEKCIEINFTLPFGEYTLFIKGVKSNKTIKIEPTEEELVACDRDDDCIAVENGCCGCGGTDTTNKAINKKYYNYWLDKRTERCKTSGCYFLLGSHWTCSAKPKCVNGKCILV